MSNVSALDREVWDKFFSNIDYYLSIGDDDRSGFSDQPQADFVREAYGGIDVEGVVPTRRGQQRFRTMVMASYDHACAISGISDKRLLVASHIAPWATHKDRRLDPRNGICLNALFDRAFDSGVIAISDDYDLLFSRHVSQENMDRLSRTGTIFHKPAKFAPDVDLLREHRRRFGFS